MGDCMNVTVEVEKYEKHNEDCYEVEIFFDEKGLEFLIRNLKLLCGQEPGEHTHLLSDSWVGWQLSEQEITGSPKRKIAKQLIFTMADFTNPPKNLHEKPEPEK